MAKRRMDHVGFKIIIRASVSPIGHRRKKDTPTPGYCRGGSRQRASAYRRLCFAKSCPFQSRPDRPTGSFREWSRNFAGCSKPSATFFVGVRGLILSAAADRISNSGPKEFVIYICPSCLTWPVCGNGSPSGLIHSNIRYLRPACFGKIYFSPLLGGHNWGWKRNQSLD